MMAKVYGFKSVVYQCNGIVILNDGRSFEVGHVPLFREFWGDRAKFEEIMRLKNYIRFIESWKSPRRFDDLY